MIEHKNVKSAEQTLKEYKAYLQDEERSRVTVEKYVRDTRKLMGFLAEDADIEKKEVRKCKEMLRGQYKVINASSMLAATNHFFVLLGKEELKVELFKIQKSTHSRLEKEMTEKGCAGLIRAARVDGGEWINMLFRTLGNTGIRISELKFMTAEAVNERRAEIYNRGKLYVVLPPAELTGLSGPYCKKAGICFESIFITRDGNTMDRNNISRRMKQLGGKTGVDMAEVSPHNLQHLFAKTFYSVEKDAVRLISLLEHSNINTARVCTMTTERQPRRRTSRMKLVPS